MPHSLLHILPQDVLSALAIDNDLDGLMIHSVTPMEEELRVTKQRLQKIYNDPEAFMRSVRATRIIQRWWRNYLSREEIIFRWDNEGYTFGRYPG